MKRILIAAVSVVAVAATAFVAYPQADAAARWRLDFEPGELKVIVAGGSPHYYLPYTVKNGTDAARAPRIRLALETETGKTHGDHFDGATFKAVARKTHVDSIDSTLRLRTKELGAGASGSAMAQFGRIDPNADNFEVRVYGLWDAIVRDRRGVVWSERRVLVLKYARTGDEYRRHEDPIRFVSKSQEVEGERVKLHGGPAE